VKGEIGQ